MFLWPLYPLELLKKSPSSLYQVNSQTYELLQEVNNLEISEENNVQNVQKRHM